MTVLLADLGEVAQEEIWQGQVFHDYQLLALIRKSRGHWWASFAFPLSLVIPASWLAVWIV